MSGREVRAATVGPASLSTMASREDVTADADRNGELRAHAPSPSASLAPWGDVRARAGSMGRIGPANSLSPDSFPRGGGGSSQLVRSQTLDAAGVRQMLFPCDGGWQGGAGDPLSESEVQGVQCLMPNGILLELLAHPDDEIRRVKEVAIERATSDEKLPLRGCLSPDAGHYSVTCVNAAGRRMDCLDESRSLRQVRPFCNVLKLVKKSNDEQHYVFRHHVGKLIGKSLADFENLRDPEVNDFRWRIKALANTIAQLRWNRLKGSLRDRIKYQYPPRVVSHPHVEDAVAELTVHLSWDGRVERRVATSTRVDHWLSELGGRWGVPEQRVAAAVVKVVGQDVFLLDNHRIADYEYVRERMAMGKIPRLRVVDASLIDVEEAPEKVYRSLELEAAHNTRHSGSSLCAPVAPLGTSDEPPVPSREVARPFSVRVESLTLSVETRAVGVFRSLGLQLGLFHGGKRLCPLKAVSFKGVPDAKGVIRVQQVLPFDLSVCDLPRMAKLCVGVYELKQFRGNALHPLFWVNVTPFDYRSRLRRAGTFHMWSYSTGRCMPTHATLSPLRGTIGNPNLKEAADVVLNFAGDEPRENIYHMPGLCEEKKNASLRNGDSLVNAHIGTINKLFTQELRDIADRDPLHDLTEQEKDLIWKIREYCLTQLPELLPRIIDCVDYANSAQVEELRQLLERWPLLSTERALQLLDYAYPDLAVRRFAVHCLRQASDDTVLRYLLQLAQALKHESSLHSPLVEFLLERALSNQHIGHHLFWELRAEMNSPSSGLLFGLLLEAYLSAAPEHFALLEQQHALLDKCRATADTLAALQESGVGGFERARTRFQLSARTQLAGRRPLRNFVSPLNPWIRCRRVKLEQCRLMNSKTRPQMLAFENGDGEADLDDVVFMYKKGDDLRQDRLTLQLLKVMDLLWKDTGLDLRLSLYSVVSTDADEGFIEVVQSAETLCRIQMRGGSLSNASSADPRLATSRAAFKKGLLLNWLKQHNGGSRHAMRRAQWEFTRSCAGYSVATYVLGIGDRHNDNIMVKTNGQLFHIDFGHFLGNFKHKFGIRRERVPLTLSAEFVEVIKADFGVSNNFGEFRDLCERAFLTLRRRGSLLVSLLAMMISTGLPELSSEQDLNVVRSTLQLDRGASAAADAAALERFRRDFDQSLRDAWKISLDWWFHMLNQRRPKVGKG